MLAMGAPPLLVMVSAWGELGTPGCWLVKVRLEGLMVKAAGATPAPDRATVWVRSESATVRVPVKAPD